MRIFSIECSAASASVAILDDGKLLSESYTNTGLTHSQTLIPMAKNALDNASIDIDSIDLFSIAAGPGSFTGIRIGIAALKGLAMAQNKPCFPVSTLEAMAYNVLGRECIVCCVMDARCNQVYTATFKSGQKIERITQDEAVMIDELANKLKNYDLPIVFVGDGAELCYNKLKSTNDNVLLAPTNFRYQKASSVAACTFEKIKMEPTILAEEILPVYLRAPQAERELKKRMENSK